MPREPFPPQQPSQPYPPTQHARFLSAQRLGSNQTIVSSTFSSSRFPTQQLLAAPPPIPVQWDEVSCCWRPEVSAKRQGGGISQHPLSLSPKRKHRPTGQSWKVSAWPIEDSSNSSHSDFEEEKHKQESKKRSSVEETTGGLHPTIMPAPMEANAFAATVPPVVPATVAKVVPYDENMRTEVVTTTPASTSAHEETNDFQALSRQPSKKRGRWGPRPRDAAKLFEAPMTGVMEGVSVHVPQAAPAASTVATCVARATNKAHLNNKEGFVGEESDDDDDSVQVVCVRPAYFCDVVQSNAFASDKNLTQVKLSQAAAPLPATRELPKKETMMIPRTKEGKPICCLCQRFFETVEKLRYHEQVSALHKENLKKLKKSESVVEVVCREAIETEHVPVKTTIDATNACSATHGSLNASTHGDSSGNVQVFPSSQQKQSQVLYDFPMAAADPVLFLGLEILEIKQHVFQSDNVTKNIATQASECCDSVTAGAPAPASLVVRLNGIDYRSEADFCASPRRKKTKSNPTQDKQQNLQLQQDHTAIIPAQGSTKIYGKSLLHPQTKQKQVDLAPQAAPPAETTATIIAQIPQHVVMQQPKRQNVKEENKKEGNKKPVLKIGNTVKPSIARRKRSYDSNSKAGQETKRPRGRPPVGKEWDAERGKYVPTKEQSKCKVAHEETRLIKEKAAAAPPPSVPAAESGQPQREIKIPSRSVSSAAKAKTKPATRKQQLLEKLLELVKRDAQALLEREKAELLSSLPESVLKRFGCVGFCKWAKSYLPALSLSPYSIQPGEARDKWMEMFKEMQSTGRSLEKTNLLVYWYGEQDPGNRYSLVSPKRFIPYEEAKPHMLDFAKRAQQKHALGKRLSTGDQARLRALDEMRNDLAKPNPEDRKPFDFLEGFEHTTVDDLDVDSDFGDDEETFLAEYAHDCLLKLPGSGRSRAPSAKQCLVFPSTPTCKNKDDHSSSLHDPNADWVPKTADHSNTSTGAADSNDDDDSDDVVDSSPEKAESLSEVDELPHKDDLTVKQRQNTQTDDHRSLEHPQSPGANRSDTTTTSNIRLTKQTRGLRSLNRILAKDSVIVTNQGNEHDESSGSHIITVPGGTSSPAVLLSDTNTNAVHSACHRLDQLHEAAPATSLEEKDAGRNHVLEAGNEHKSEMPKTISASPAMDRGSNETASSVVAKENAPLVSDRSKQDSATVPLREKQDQMSTRSRIRKIITPRYGHLKLNRHGQPRAKVKPMVDSGTPKSPNRSPKRKKSAKASPARFWDDSDEVARFEHALLARQNTQGNERHCKAGRESPPYCSGGQIKSSPSCQVAKPKGAGNPGGGTSQPKSSTAKLIIDCTLGDEVRLMTSLKEEGVSELIKGDTHPHAKVKSSRLTRVESSSTGAADNLREGRDCQLEPFLSNSFPEHDEARGSSGDESEFSIHFPEISPDEISMLKRHAHWAVFAQMMTKICEERDIALERVAKLQSMLLDKNEGRGQLSSAG
ncbi:hypothetical protein ACA910_006461 [Epithemia clementina (nom. ined.)]